LKRKLFIKSEEERIVSGEVYSPLDIDTDGEAMTKEEIRKMAYKFLASGRVNKIDINHNEVESGVVVVASDIAKVNDPDGFTEGAWVLTVYVEPDEIWQKIKKGELNCFSFGGDGYTVELDSTVSVPKEAIGKTELSLKDVPLPPHDHDVHLTFDENGDLIPTETGKTLNHVHYIKSVSATEVTFDHAHRIIFEEE